MAQILHMTSDTVLLGRLPLWKRALDVVGATIGIIVLTPLLLAISLYIKLVSPGPVLYRSARVGHGGKEFTMWKFRSMDVDVDVADHEKYVKSLIRNGCDSKNGEEAPMTKIEDAPSFIPLAAVIRKTCIDEIPQLVNVLRGEMSLVGPRPAIAYETEEYLRWHRARLSVLPGMTGLWQVSGKNRLTFREMVALDIRYSREMSLLLDIKILLMTIPAILGQVGDYLESRKGMDE